MENLRRKEADSENEGEVPLCPCIECIINQSPLQLFSISIIIGSYPILVNVITTWLEESEAGFSVSM